MDLKERMNECASYLKAYLEDFIQSGRFSDVHYFVEDREAIPQEMSDLSSVRAVDFHQTRFSRLYDSLPKTNAQDLISVVSNLDNLLIVDIGSEYGGEFSLRVAKENSEVEVQVYNPQVDFVFCKEIIVHEGPGLPLANDDSDLLATGEAAVNKFYQMLGVEQATFHQQALYEQEMEQIVRANPDKTVLFFSYRTPTIPQDLLPQIARVVGRNKNAEMVVVPFIDRVEADTEMMELIGENLHLKGGQDPSSTTNTSDARTRLYLVMSQYVAGKAAEQADADLYKLPEKNVFHRPAYIISTVRL